MELGERSDSLTWLENPNDQKVIDWVNKKVIITQDYFDQNPSRKDLRKTVEFFCNQPKYEMGILGNCLHDQYFILFEDRKFN